MVNEALPNNGRAWAFIGSFRHQRGRWEQIAVTRTSPRISASKRRDRPPVAEFVSFGPGVTRKMAKACSCCAGRKLLDAFRRLLSPRHHEKMSVINDLEPRVR